MPTEANTKTALLFEGWKFILGQQTVPVQGALRHLSSRSGQGQPCPSTSPGRGWAHGTAQLSHVWTAGSGSTDSAVWKSPACPQHSARQRQGLLWADQPTLLAPRGPLSKRLLHANQGTDWNIRPLVSWQPARGRCLSQELCSPSCCRWPARSLRCYGNASISLRKKQGRTNHLDCLNTTPRLQLQNPF